MATDRQVASNRRNGALSRGPKTLAGKARSSRNAVKHGLSISITSDRASGREIEVLARKLAQLGPGTRLGRRGSRRKLSSSLIGYEARLRRFLRAQGSLAAGLMKRNGLRP
jgi:hypothetical protein